MNWLEWTPNPSKITESEEIDPTKPSKPSSVGFVGSNRGESQKVDWSGSGGFPQIPSDDLITILRGRALELWSDKAGGRLFIVADLADANRLKERRGEILTVDELQILDLIDDPVFAAEVLRWKRKFDCTLSAVRKSALSTPVRR